MREFSDAVLAPLTTMRIGGPATRLVVADTVDEVVDTLREVDDAHEPLLVISGGSNLVISDEGFAGTVLRVATEGIERVGREGDHVLVRVAGGEVWDDLVAFAVRQGWSGVECLPGIPGLVGATPVQNVGAYGQDVSQTIAAVRVYDRIEQSVLELTNEQCEFSYRHSLFKASGRYVVLDVVFRFEVSEWSQPIRYTDLAEHLGVSSGDRVELAQAREGVLAQRRRRGMVLDEADHDTWSCGSFFTNPQLDPGEWARFAERVTERLGPQGQAPQFPGVGQARKTSAAWLIDQSGFGKGYGLPGPAALSSKHSLAITNRGTATAADVVALARKVRDGVREAFDVTLVNEPVFVGHSL